MREHIVGTMLNCLSDPFVHLRYCLEQAIILTAAHIFVLSEVPTSGPFRGRANRKD